MTHNRIKRIRRKLGDPVVKSSHHRHPHIVSGFAPNAFTLVELLVVIAIIGVLIGLLVPALQNMRELSRRSTCEQNLVQLSLAMSSYSTQFGHYPAGSVNPTGPIKNEAKGYHHNWIASLLPMLDAQNVYNAIDRDISVYADANTEVRGLSIPNLICPSASGVLPYTTCYAGMHASTETPIDESNDGVFRLNLPVSERDITDGLSYTVFVGEKISSPDEELGWISGTRSSLRNAGHAINAELRRVRRPATNTQPLDPLYVGGLASDHLGGAYLLMGGGEYQFRSSSMDTRLLAQFASRSDGEIPSDWKVGVEAATPPPAAKTSPVPASPDAATPDPASPDAEPQDAATTKEAADDGNDSGKSDGDSRGSKSVKSKETQSPKTQSPETQSPETQSPEEQPPKDPPPTQE
ncbi:MAG: DUF1559 domain-containing protein [Pirellulaceae bacterium]|nr:DUF1559 domain-containing protein [Pirellulaceae bacterium]